MALLFWDGAEGYQSDGDLQAKYSALGAVADATGMLTSTTVRTGSLGTRSWRGNTSTGTVNYITVSDLNTVIVEFWTRAFSTGNNTVLYLRDSSNNTHCSITRTLSGTDFIYRVFNANSVQVGTDKTISGLTTWVHIGIKLTTGAAGTVTVRFDDVVHLNAVSSDFLSGSNNFVSRVGFSAAQQSNSSTFYDDIVIMDTTGSDNDFKGSGLHCVASFPTAAGDSTQWTPSAGSNFQNVDDTDPDDDTTYNSSNSNGQLDLYNITDLPAFNGSVLGVDIWSVLRKTTGGTEEAKLALKTNSAIYYGDNIALTSSYALYRKQQILNPTTGVAFTQAEANALQIGVEVT